MSTLKQIEANRLNAERSTGPKSSEGKAVVSKNAIKHGLLSTQTLLPSEDGGRLERLGQNLHEQLNPQGELELVLVDRIISMVWRLWRLSKIETDVLKERFGTPGTIFIHNASSFGNLSRYESSLERGLLKALHELQRVQAMRTGVAVTLPVAVDIQGDGEKF